MTNVNDLIKYFDEGKADLRLAELYGMESVVGQRLRYRNALEKYKTLFGVQSVKETQGIDTSNIEFQTVDRNLLDTNSSDASKI